MPTTAVKANAAQRTQALVKDLTNVLQQPGLSPGEPLVVENQIAQTKSIHAIVIWDRWGDLLPAKRSAVILDAYMKAKRQRGFTITVAVGLTSEEALRMGFVPYSIVTTRRQGDRASLGQLAKAMAGAGGIVVKVGSSTQLRFATLEQAEDAYRHLSQKVPGPYWAIVQEQTAGE
jgi:hypothetical protein